MESLEITKLFKDVFNNPAGLKCLEHLEKQFCDRPIYKDGQTHEQTAFREGQRNIVAQIRKEVNKDGR